MSQLSKNEQDAIRELKAEVSRRYRLLEMKLFGSKVRGSSDGESDIDLLIVLEEVNWRVERDIYELCFEIGLEYDLLLSPTILSRAETNNKLTRSTPFYRVVQREGVAV